MVDFRCTECGHQSRAFDDQVGQFPPKIPLTGRTDLHNATFGIGGSKEESQRAIDLGYSTGFRQRRETRPPKR